MYIDRSEAILDYFRSHPYITPSKVAKAVGYDFGSLSKLINKTGRLTAIPSQYLEPLQNILKDYGFISSPMQQIHP